MAVDGNALGCSVMTDELTQLDQLAAIAGVRGSWFAGERRAEARLKRFLRRLESAPLVVPEVARRLIPQLRDEGKYDQALALGHRIGPLADRPPEVPEALGDCHLAQGGKEEAAMWFSRSLLEGPSPERLAKFCSAAGIEENPDVAAAYESFSSARYEEARHSFAVLRDRFPEVAAFGVAEKQARLRVIARDSFCARPFTDVHVNTGGNATPCCPGWLPVSLGKVGEQSMQEVWNGPAAREVRETMLDGSMRYCVLDRCPFLGKPDSIRRDQIKDARMLGLLQSRETRLDQGPQRVALNYDTSCNLACPSCRPEFIHLQGEKLREVEAIQEHVLEEWLTDASRLKTNNAGDTFGSPLGRKLLKDMGERTDPKLRVELITNGMLLTPGQWERIGHLHHRIDSLEISVDAAKAETYAVVRRGGNFERLRKNLEFVREKRREGYIRFWRLSFVVQNRNFREMPDFVRMALGLEVDEIVFKKFIPRSWIARDMDLYRSDYGVHDPANPEHAAFLEVLKDPVLADPHVHWHSLNAFFEEVHGRGLFQEE